MHAAPDIYELGGYFAQLVVGGGCDAIKVEPDFWTNGIATLPPGRLVSVLETRGAWQSWECHPNGDELILQLDGTLALRLDYQPAETRTLQTGQFVIIPKGIWHTADESSDGKALFITQGEGTMTRPR
jgi:mannose-6-phosphate isomerase-like protein (cupin superfamily)